MIAAEFSHILVFSMLFIAAVFDIRSDLGDVPDMFAWIAIAGGVALHGLQSYLSGSLDPLLFSLGVGLVFSAYGFLAYWEEMWGGADAMALAALGFAAPFTAATLAGTVRHSVSLFINIVLVATVYTLAFSLVRSVRKEGFMHEYADRIRREKKSLIVISGAGLAVFGILDPFYGFAAYIGILLVSFLYIYLKVVEDFAMVEQVDAEELEGGEVLKGSRVRGVTEEEIDGLEGPVEVVHGIRFLPVFPLALVLTDAGFTLIQYVIFG